ncbi:hypothetical protein chiPu_0018076 [Chiloscyllium punctatum]|uniref:Uncharacterized protein n=1 Tax=Chiloscyllium punctatum TaxID=137246 RepID=A0A401RL23_CHIPU|nr:hypothetical protein [Chiloscyllium punctatum]
MTPNLPAFSPLPTDPARMAWPTRSLAAVVFALTLMLFGTVRAGPLTDDGHREHQSPDNLKENGQTPHYQGQGLFPENGKMPEGDAETLKSHQVRSAPSQPKPEPSYDDELFKDVDAKTLAAILLQALKVDTDQPSTREEPRQHDGVAPPSTDLGSPEVEANDLTENVKSRTRVGKTQRSPISHESEESDWRNGEDGEDSLTPQNIDRLETMLQDLERYSAATKRERSNTAQLSLTKGDQSTENDVLRDLDAFEELVGRKEKYSDYEESQEDTRDRVKYSSKAPEVSRWKSGQQRAKDRASDLLLQYLLKGESSQEEEEEEEKKVRDNRGKVGGDSEDSASQEKRSDEDEDEDEDIDPQTIDRLIEISSKLHLPADDVIDIINDVEKKRKDPTERLESRYGASSRDRYKTPDSNYLPRHRPEKTRHHVNNELSLQDLLGANNALDYDSMAYPVPRRYRLRPNGYPNYIHPRVSPPRYRPYYYQPPPPVYRNKEYYEDEDNEEELENYIEKILLKHPEVFQ